MEKEGQAEAGVEVSRVFYPHDSFLGTMAAGDLVAPQLLQRDLLVGKCDAAAGPGKECTWNKATRGSPSGGARFSQPACGRKLLGEEGREADLVSPPPPPPQEEGREADVAFPIPGPALPPSALRQASDLQSVFPAAWWGQVTADLGGSVAHPGYDPPPAEFGEIRWGPRKGPGFGVGSLASILALPWLGWVGVGLLLSPRGLCFLFLELDVQVTLPGPLLL